VAKVRFGGIAQDARGKIDGIVYSRNQYGGYVRVKVSPVQPNTARQTLVRNRTALLSKRFSTVITEAQRAAWSVFGAAHPKTDVFGNPQALSGIASYVRLNQVILNAGGTIIDTPPPDLEVAGLLSMTATASAGAGTLSITFTPTPLGAGLVLYIWSSEGKGAAVNFFRPFLRFIGVSPAAPASPFAAGALYTAKFGPLVAGQAIGVLVGVCDPAKGAVSPGVFQRVVVT